MASKQQLMDQILKQESGETDHSLRKKAFDRAVGGGVPKTLTAWEWEDYYKEFGVPPGHTIKPLPAEQSWWRRIFLRGN